MKTLPYVYKLTHLTTKEFYIGVRWGNKVPSSEDLGKKYFSSSLQTKPRFQEFAAEVIAEFIDKEDAIDYEQKLITEHWGDPLLLNKAIQVSKTFRCTGHTQETKNKMSAAKRGKPPNNKGTTLSDETKQRIREKALLYRHTPESIEKIREKAMGNKRGLGNKSRTGQKQSDEEKEKKRIASTGKVYSEESKRKMSEAKKGIPKPKFECPHCNRMFDPTNLARYHNDKCKSRIIN